VTSRQAVRLAALSLILQPVFASLAAPERKPQTKTVAARPVRTIGHVMKCVALTLLSMAMAASLA
jgi:hypothetical protein